MCFFFQPPIVVLHVTVVEAEGLEAKDANGKWGNKNVCRNTVLYHFTTKISGSVLMAGFTRVRLMSLGLRYCSCATVKLSEKNKTKKFHVEKKNIVMLFPKIRVRIRFLLVYITRLTLFSSGLSVQNWKSHLSRLVQYFRGGSH